MFGSTQYISELVFMMDFSKCPEKILSLAPDQLLVLMKQKMQQEQNMETKFLMKAAANHLRTQVFSKSEVVKILPVQNCKLKQDKENDVIVTENASVVIETVKESLSHSLFLMIHNWFDIAKIRKHKRTSKALSTILNLLCQITETLRKILNASTQDSAPTVEENFQLACYLAYKK